MFSLSTLQAIPPMKPLYPLILTLLTACGPNFEAIDETSNDPTPTSGNSGALASAGTAGLPDVSTGGSPGASAGGAGLDANVAGANVGGNGAMAGGPAMGPGVCLANYQQLYCASVCSDSEQTGCGEVIRCFIAHDSNSIDNCPGFDQTAYTLASQAERNCCK